MFIDVQESSRDFNDTSDCSEDRITLFLHTSSDIGTVPICDHQQLMRAFFT